jgi:hypothetical protein
MIVIVLFVKTRYISDCLKVLENLGSIVLELIFGFGEQDIGLLTLTTLSHEFSNCY